MFKIMLFLAAVNVCFSAEYYIDSVKGNDKNDGKTQSQAFKTLEKANSVNLLPGDKMLFASGSSYDGRLKPLGEGTAEKPIYIGVYGEGKRPIINGRGIYDEAVWLYNTKYIHLTGLELTNEGPAPKAKRRGLKIEIQDYGTSSGIMMSNLFIHNVNGSVIKKDGGGSAILWRNGGRKVRSRFDGLIIEDCLLKDCTRNGINSQGYTNRKDWYPSLNVVVRNNVLEGIPGDGIVPIGCDGAIVEGNVMRDCPRMLLKGDAAAGIWPWSSDNTIIQHNEVSDHKAPWDAQGFDSDWNCNGTIIQYNYSHDNEGGFLLVCCNGKASPTSAINNGTIVRYNISINDGLRAEGYAAGFSPTFHITGPVKNTSIYNNLIYVPKKTDDKIDTTIVKMDNWGDPYPDKTLFANNIIYVEDQADFVWAKSTNNKFASNVFFGNMKNIPEDKTAIFADPSFQRVLRKVDGKWDLDALKIREDSPCKDAGIIIDDNGGKDYLGKPLEAKTVNVGPFE